MKLNGLFSKVAAAAVVGVLLVGCLPVSALAQTTYTRGTFTYGAAENSGNLPDTFAYTDDYFTESADTSNTHLAIMSLQMAAASMSSNEAAYENKSECIVDLMSKIGFDGIEVNDDYKTSMTPDTLGVATGYKKLSDGSVLLAIVPRSAGYEHEWANNLIVGSDGIHAGFKQSREKAYAFVKQFVSAHASEFSGKTVKVWTAGYSRGAGVSNVIAAGIVDDSKAAIGLDVARENVYSYNFGCAYTTSQELASAGTYSNIHNYVSDGDFIGMTPPIGWGMARYGTTTTVNSTDSATKNEMLSLLKSLNANVYNEYIENGDPDSFTSKKLEFNDDGFSIVDDDSKSTTQVEFLNGRIAQMLKAMPDRTIYASAYQEPLSQMVMLLKTNTGFAPGIMGSASRNKLLISMFFYSIVNQAVDSCYSSEELMATMGIVLALQPGLKTGNETVDAILASDEWAAVYPKVSEIAVEGLTAPMKMLDAYQNMMGGYMAEVLRDALSSCGYSGSDLENHTLLQGDGPKNIAVAVSLLVFGTDDSLPTSTDEAANMLLNKAAVAVTFYSNANRFSRVHDNDVMISWLRAEDPDSIPATDPEPEPESKPSDQTGETTAETVVESGMVTTTSAAVGSGGGHLPSTGDSAPAEAAAAAVLAGASIAGIGFATRKRFGRE